MSRSLRILYFLPHRGRLQEISKQKAEKLTRVPRPEWRPDAIAVGCVDGVSMLYVQTIHGQKRCWVPTTQSRKVCEAAIAVAMVHAVVAFGMAAAEQYVEVAA